MRAPHCRVRLTAFLVAALATAGRAQSCLNYGTSSAGNTCVCPPGIAGSLCEQSSCGNPLLGPTSRALFNDSLAGASGAGGCGQQCSNGFTGPHCNTCTAASACSAALAGSAANATSTTGSSAIPSGLATSGGLGGGVDASGASDVTCSTGAWAWAASFASCAVVNPTLQSVFPGTTTLTFAKTVHPTLSLSSPWGTSNSLTAEVWYSPSTGNTSLVEQFFCKADTCVQSNTTTSGVNWSCENLSCTCIPGTLWCGGGGAVDLSGTINSLASTIAISCDASGQNCNFIQATLQTLFGQNGLALTSCLFGECIRESTINTLANTFSPSTVANGSTLSKGVIAGLSIVAAVAFLALLCLGFGFWSQSKARNAPVGQLDEKSGVGLRWTDIGFTLAPKSRVGRRGNADDGRVLLDGISGEVASGELLAILGPTGAGKSTLVDLLAGRRKSGRSTGSIEIVSSTGSSNRRVKIGYVDQQDILPSTSTVREHLMFSAQLRLPEGMSKAAKEKRVFDVLSQLGLLDVADSRIGGTERRGISGGERRRLSIGLELLAAPSILIADEPTSGLDSVSAKRVISVLKDLANSGSTTVIATIHQPNSQIFHMFDLVLTLSRGGRQLYFGRAATVAQHFAALGHSCPEGWNPADYLLELASDPPADLLPPVAPRAATRIDLRKGSAGSDLRDGDSSEEGKESAPTLPILHNFPPRSDGRQSQQRPTTVLLTQFQVLAGRQLRNLKRDWSLVLMHNAVAVVVGVLVGGLYFQVNSTISGFQNRIGSLFFLGSLLAFASLSALSNFVQVKPLFLRERANNLYGPMAFLLSEVFFDIVPLRIAPTIIVSCIIYWMVGLSPSAAHFFKFLLILVEFNVASTLFNLLLGAALDNSGVAILISAVINLFQMAFAGFFVNLKSIPPVLRWVQWLAPLKSTLEALAVNELSSGLQIIDTLQGVKIEVNAALIMDILFGFKPDGYYRDVLILFGFVGGFGLLLISTVVYRLKERR